MPSKTRTECHSPVLPQGEPLNAVDPATGLPGMVLCARQPDAVSTSALLVAPCFLPNVFGGDYWVVAVGAATSEGLC